MMKATQGSLHTGGQDPRLRPEQQHRLNYYPEKVTRHLRIRPLPAQNPQHPPPTLPRLLKVAYQYRPVIIYHRNHPPQIL